MSSIGSKFLKFLGLLATVSSLCGTAQAQPKVVIGLPVAGYSPLVPVYAARDLGYFAKNGVSVDIVAFKGGGAMQEALAAGAADLIANSATGGATAILKGVKQKIVGSINDRPIGWHLVVLSDSPIKSVKDLDGKTVGVTTTGSLTDFYAQYVAKQAGIRIKAVPVGGGGIVPSLKGRQVDAAVMSAPLPYELLQSKAGRSIFDFAQLGGESLPDVWIASQRMIDANPQAIEAVMKSVYQATAYMKQNRVQGLALMKKYSSQTDEKILEYETDVVLQGVSTAARIEPAAFKFAFDLAKDTGVNLPPAGETYIDRFFSVDAR